MRQPFLLLFLLKSLVRILQYICKALHPHSCIYLHVSHVVVVPPEPVGDKHFASENAETS